MKYLPKLLPILFFLSSTLLLAQGRKNKSTNSGAVDNLEKLKQEAIAAIDQRKDQAQQINDMLFSFAELGFQEVESFTYLTTLLEKEGFTIQKGIAGMPTAWIAT